MVNGVVLLAKAGTGQMCNLSDGIWEDGIRQGLECGEKRLIRQICKKNQKGKSLALVAEELEEEEDAIQAIYEAVLDAAPDYDVDQIYEALHSNDMRECMRQLV